MNDKTLKKLPEELKKMRVIDMNGEQLYTVMSLASGEESDTRKLVPMKVNGEEYYTRAQLCEIYTSVGISILIKQKKLHPKGTRNKQIFPAREVEELGKFRKHLKETPNSAA